MNKFFNIYTFLIILFTLVGGFLRFYKFTTNPPELNIDEVSYGYNAYSILKTAKDEYGTFMPLTFKSVGDYKSPVPIYFLVPFVALFGLNAFAVRLPAVLLGTISIPIFFFIFRRLTGNKFAALIAAGLIAISPWSIYYSRYNYEPLYAVLFLSIGIYLFDKFQESGGKFLAILSSFFTVLTIYTTIADRLFLPIFIIAILIIYKKSLLKRKHDLVVYLVATFIFALPMLISTIWGPSAARAGMVFLTKDIDYTRYGMLDNSTNLPFFIKPIYNVIILVIFWLSRYLGYFESSFLYFNGLGMTTQGSLGLGITYLFELPLFLAGIWLFIKNKVRSQTLLIIWFLIGILPSSLANNDQSSGRSLIILPVLAIISGVGGAFLISKIKQMKNTAIRNLVVSVFLLVFCWQITNAVLIFSIHFPIERGEAFMQGMKEVMTYAIDHQNEYDEIVVDPYRGIEAPNVVGVPHMYYLFYSKYDPKKYQTEKITQKSEYYHFDKITIRKVYWPDDRKTKKTLFIASPWSIDTKDVNGTTSKIVERVYVRGENLALLVVSNN